MQAATPADVYKDYGGFLALVARWISERAASRSHRTTLACEAIRGAKTKDGTTVWAGVGVYTVCEIFFLAGMCPSNEPSSALCHFYSINYCRYFTISDRTRGF
jgi:hypothetical protein